MSDYVPLSRPSGSGAAEWSTITGKPAGIDVVSQDVVVTPFAPAIVTGTVALAAVDAVPTADENRVVVRIGPAGAQSPYGIGFVETVFELANGTVQDMLDFFNGALDGYVMELSEGFLRLRQTNSIASTAWIYTGYDYSSGYPAAGIPADYSGSPQAESVAGRTVLVRDTHTLVTALPDSRVGTVDLGPDAGAAAIRTLDNFGVSADDVFVIYEAANEFDLTGTPVGSHTVLDPATETLGDFIAAVNDITPGVQFSLQYKPLDVEPYGSAYLVFETTGLEDKLFGAAWNVFGLPFGTVIGKPSRDLHAYVVSLEERLKVLSDRLDAIESA